MRKSERISALLGMVLAIISLAGASVELHSQTSAGQALDAAGQVVLHRIINSADDPELRWPDFTPYQAEVKDFYSRTNSTLGWVRDRKPTPEALVMIGLFTMSDQKGLVPEDSDASRWPARMQKLQASPSDIDLANIDVVMTVSTMRFIRALHVGRVNPKTLGRQLDVDERKYDLGEFVYDKVIQANDPAEVVRSVEPTFSGYLRTLDALGRYREFSKEDTGIALSVPGKSIAPGGTYVDLPDSLRPSFARSS
jgi:hypothetical protein